MKKLCAIITCFCLIGNLQGVPRFKTNARLDSFTIFLTDSEGGDDKLTVNMRGDKGYSENFDGGNKDDIFLRTLGSNIGICTVTGDGQYYLWGDSRPYKDFYTDINIVISALVTGVHTLEYLKTRVAVLNVATAIELRNSEDDSFCHNFLKDPICRLSLSKGVISTYYLRIWGANRVKEGTRGEWEDENSWEGIPPSPENNNNYIVIPPNAEITIPENMTVTIDAININHEGMLVNKGTLNTNEVYLGTNAVKSK